MPAKKRVDRPDNEVHAELLAAQVQRDRHAFPIYRAKQAKRAPLPSTTPVRKRGRRPDEARHESLFRIWFAAIPLKLDQSAMLEHLAKNGVHLGDTRDLRRYVSWRNPLFRQYFEDNIEAILGLPDGK